MNNRPAPDFSLCDQNGSKHSLHDYRGSWLVLYFYAKDESLACTAESCSFRDEYRIIKQFGNAEVVGVNHGSVQSHQAFAAKNQLNFPILSDPDHVVTSNYNSWKNLRRMLLGKNFATQKNTFIINPDGIIVHSYTGVRRPSKHAQRVIEDLQALQANYQTTAVSA